MAYNPAVRIVFLFLVLCSDALAQRWSVQTTGLDTNLRGISVKYVSTKGKRDFIVWASGSNGVILRSTNSGESWKQLNVQGASNLDFRDIEGFDADTAYVMSRTAKPMTKAKCSKSICHGHLASSSAPVTEAIAPWNLTRRGIHIPARLH